ncbi:MAG: hypothetical protein JWO77_3454, partial [Ilumatobacteraceae bacterium]|nr:hypothetical protein [Ilumatobacteraceae bacterium]
GSKVFIELAKRFRSILQLTFTRPLTSDDMSTLTNLGVAPMLCESGMPPHLGESADDMHFKPLSVDEYGRLLDFLKIEHNDRRAIDRIIERRAMSVDEVQAAMSDISENWSTVDAWVRGEAYVLTPVGTALAYMSLKQAVGMQQPLLDFLI